MKLRKRSQFILACSLLIAVVIGVLLGFPDLRQWITKTQVITHDFDPAIVNECSQCQDKSKSFRNFCEITDSILDGPCQAILNILLSTLGEIVTERGDSLHSMHPPELLEGCPLTSTTLVARDVTQIISTHSRAFPWFQSGLFLLEEYSQEQTELSTDLSQILAQIVENISQVYVLDDSLRETLASVFTKYIFTSEERWNELASCTIPNNYLLFRAPLGNGALRKSLGMQAASPSSSPISSASSSPSPTPSQTETSNNSTSEPPEIAAAASGDEGQTGYELTAQLCPNGELPGRCGCEKCPYGLASDSVISPCTSEIGAVPGRCSLNNPISFGPLIINSCATDMPGAYGIRGAFNSFASWIEPYRESTQPQIPSDEIPDLLVLVVGTGKRIPFYPIRDTQATIEGPDGNFYRQKYPQFRTLHYPDLLIEYDLNTRSLTLTWGPEYLGKAVYGATSRRVPGNQDVYVSAIEQLFDSNNNITSYEYYEGDSSDIKSVRTPLETIHFEKSDRSVRVTRSLTGDISAPLDNNYILYRFDDNGLGQIVQPEQRSITVQNHPGTTLISSVMRGNEGTTYQYVPDQNGALT
ncbi:MAG: hypothetical protein KDD60_06940, partial [Bdellovibrionales bacterium]|nr:hypothetical protein [Bdellovibrionales bacterium]